MKKFIIFLIILILLLGVPAYFTFNVVTHPLSTTEDINLEVKTGETLYNILENLKGDGKIKSVILIKGYIKITKANMDIKPGMYTLKPDISLTELLNTLTGVNGDANISVTIPEGYTIEQIAEELEKDNICTKESFIKAAKDYPVPSYINTKVEEAINISTGKPCKDQGIRYNLEGYLYPDTYKFSKGTPPEDIIKTMLTKFEEMIKEAEKQTGVTLNREDGQLSRVITRASMIERECKLDKERAIISSVMVNRTAEGRQFQMDATTLYAQGVHKDVVTTNDTGNTDSAYNTYVVIGLPPGPIASPGIKSIIAAIEPAETNYIYYVLNPQTKEDHYFTDNDADFLAKQREWGYID